MTTNRGTMRLVVLMIVAAAAAMPAAAEAVSWNAGVSYHYDAAGNIWKSGEDVHVYDVVGRLVRSKTNGVWRQYEYDAFGNRTKCTQAPKQPEETDCPSGVSVVTATNRLAGSGMAYDASGNVTQLAGHTYTYDAADMIVRNDSAAGAVEYVYTADDERIAVYKATPGSWQWTVRNLDQKPLRELTSQNGTTVGTSNWQWTKDYVWREGLLLATRQADGSTFHYHLDHLGTPRRVTDGTDYIAGYHDYKPFGLEVPDGRSEAPPTRVKYTGHERDVDTVSPVDSLDYMHARYYSPGMGRFLSVDPKEQREPLSLPQGWNRYAYTQNNPLKYVDPDGEETKLAIGGRTDRNPVGHVAIIINDQVYSFGTNWSDRGANQQDWGASAQVYLDSQAGHRQTDLLTLNITPEQEQKLQQHLDANNPNATGAPKYNELSNSCTTVTQNALVRTGTMPAVVMGPITPRGSGPVSTGPAILPARVGANATNSGIVSSTQTVGTEPKVSWFRTVVNAVKEYF